MGSPELHSTGLSLTVIATGLIIALTTFPSGLYARILQEPAVPPNAIVINLDRDGAVRLDKEQIEFSQLMDRLHDIAATRSDKTVVIVAAANVAFKELVRAVEAVREAGIDRVGILKAQPDGLIRESLPPIGAAVLSVDRSGVIRLDGKKVKLREISSQLQRLFKR